MRWMDEPAHTLSERYNGTAVDVGKYQGPGDPQGLGGSHGWDVRRIISPDQERWLRRVGQEKRVGK